jgi:hypothetical protein
LRLLDRSQHEVRDVSSAHRQSTSQILSIRRSVTLCHWAVGQSRRPNNGPFQIALSKHIFHAREIRVLAAKDCLRDWRQQMTHEDSVAGVVLRRVRVSWRSHRSNGRRADGDDSPSADRPHRLNKRSRAARCDAKITGNARAEA